MFTELLDRARVRLVRGVAAEALLDGALGEHGERTWKDSSTVALSYRPSNAPAVAPRDVDYN
ncbi:hypothetical protein [Microbacterium proteolyticum]|uniref:hypothetical protein n=1 Tax=Microbacterium proteolyticum TaxID=1572644 RepID=UPI0035A852C6|nr:hypothetical protein [Microbacterium proteolyticum]